MILLGLLLAAAVPPGKPAAPIKPVRVRPGVPNRLKVVECNADCRVAPALNFRLPLPLDPRPNRKMLAAAHSGIDCRIMGWQLCVRKRRTVVQVTFDQALKPDSVTILPH